MKSKSYDNYENQGQITDISTYPIFKLKGKNSVWIFKEYDHTTDSDIQKPCIESEVLIQEFNRLIIPRLPKTRTLWSGIGSKKPSGVLSKNIEGFRPYSSINPLLLALQLFLGKITGLGEITGLLVFICEYDAKLNGNIGLDAYNQTVKIDGNESMLSKRDPDVHKRNPITPNDINFLPEVPSFAKIRNSNWLGAPLDNNTNFYSNLWLLLSFNKRFRSELHSVLLRLILLPDILIKKLIETYSTQEKWYKDELSGQFIERKQTFKNQALKVPTFFSYVKDNRNLQNIDIFINNLEKYKLQGGIKIIEGCEDSLSEIKVYYQFLQKSNPPKASLFFVNPVSILKLLLLAMLIFYLVKILRKEDERSPRIAR